MYSNSGVCEQDCIFLTPSHSEKHARPIVWVVTKYDPENYKIEMIQVLPEGVIIKLQITLIDERNDITIAELTLAKTAYSKEGKIIVAHSSNTV